MPYSAVTGSPRGPVTVARCTVPPVAATSARTVPSPPSATGTTRISAPGQTRRIPEAMAKPTPCASRLPLSDCGATTMYMGGVLTGGGFWLHSPCGRGAGGEISARSVRVRLVLRPVSRLGVFKRGQRDIEARHLSSIQRGIDAALTRHPFRETLRAIPHHLTPDGEVIVATLIGDIVGDPAQHGGLPLPLQRVFLGIGVLRLMQGARRPAAQPLNHLLPAFAHRVVSLSVVLYYQSLPCVSASRAFRENSYCVMQQRLWVFLFIVAWSVRHG